MTSYFYEESKLNVPQGISLTLFVFVCSIVLTDASSSATPNFDYYYSVEELGCDLPQSIQYSFEIFVVIFAMLGFTSLAIYLAFTKKLLHFKFNSKSVVFLLFLTYGNWMHHWSSFYKFFLAIHSFLIYRCCIEWFILPSQNGYGKSKYEQRKQNANKANTRKARALLAKQKRAEESKMKKKQEIYTSQASKEDIFSLSGDLSDYFLDLLGPVWFRFRDFTEKFELDFSSVPSFSKIPTFVADNWDSIRNCELFEEFSNLLQLAISLGWIKKINATVRGIPIFVSEPLRRSVSIWDFLEAAGSFYKLVLSIGLKVLSTGEIKHFWTCEAKNEYDNEFTFLKSQKVLIELGRKAEVDEHTYDRRLCECIATTLSLLNTCKQAERAYYSSRLSILRDISSARTLMKKDSIREKPLGLLLVGESGVGKSAIINSLCYYILECNGKDSSPRATITLNQEDKFQSEFMTHHRGVILDDICNTSLDRTDGSPATPIIMFLNNVPMSALNPNAEMKGKVMIEPDLVAGTTNVKDLLSNQLSNEPLSINRRFELTITQEVKAQYRKDGTDMLDRNKIKHMASDAFPDYALFTVEEPFYAKDYTKDTAKTGRKKKIAYEPIMYQGKPLVKVEINVLLAFLRDYSADYYASQKRFVDGQRNLRNRELCEHKMPPGMCEHCKDLEPLEGEDPLESQVGYEYYLEVISFFKSVEVDFCEWLSYTIARILKSQYGNAIIAYFHRKLIVDVIMGLLPYYVSSVVGGYVFLHFWHQLKSHFGYYTFPLIEEFMWTLVCTIVMCYFVHDRLDKARQKIIHDWSQVTLPSVWLKSVTWKTKSRILFLFGSLGVWKILVALVRRYNALPTKQAAAFIAVPKPDMKDYQKETEFWDTRAAEAKYKFGDAGVTEKSKTISHSVFNQMFGRRMLCVTKEDSTHCNAIPLKSNVILIPNHFVGKGTEYVTILKVGGHTFKNVPLDRTCTYRIPGTDLAVWYAPSAGLHKDITDYYPKDIYDGKHLDVYSLFNKSGELIQYPSMTARKERVFTTEGGTFQGYRYTFPRETFGGLCMATLIGEAQGVPFIAGHHLAGVGCKGAAGFVTRATILEAIDKLNALPCVLVSHSATPMETEVLGVNFGPLTAPHDKCVVRDLPIDAKIRVHGSHNLPLSSPKTSVITSRISKAVTTVMGIEKLHGAPKDMGAAKHKEADIAGKVDTASRFDGTIVQKAYVDYSCQLDKIPKSELAKVGKISDDVNLAGADGVMGLNAMNFATSVGFPLKGPKTKYVEKSDRVVEGISCVRDMDPLILDEVARLEAELLAGRSINTVFKAALKDEPGKLSKDKQRVFAAANTAFVMLVRKYYLTIAALVQRNKEITECAVGTVVQSPEWTELYNHIGKNGWDRAIAGDYAKFDGRMSVQFMLMSFKLMIKIAEKSGNYDADDITIMTGIASEISYPTYDYFGTLVQFFGSNPSGHPMTVVVNSLVNSLYMRYTYYAIAKDKGWWKIPLFSDVVALMTYGDDNIMTVAKGYDDFNHTAIAAEFEKVGITYTMADKDAESVPFVHLSEASFLKHFAVWDDELELYRSPVEEASIAKMLHTHIRSKVLSVEQSSAEAIQNVALKYFEFGRDVYTKRVKELQQVALDSGINSYVTPIPTYDERMLWYKTKFEL
jgi:signal recognition particle GTPase